MAKPSQVQERAPANLSREDMSNAIPKIERRIEELKQFNIDEITDRFDPRIDSFVRKIDDGLIEILGHNTIDYDRYRITSLDDGPLMMGGIDLWEAKEGIKKGFHSAIVKLSSIIETFKEKIQDTPEDPSARAKRTLAELNIHPELMKGIGKLFQNGHYPNAVEDGCKILEGFVKIRSMCSDLSGTNLMLKVFSPKNPVLQFNDLKTETDKSEQQGMMYLYAGTMLALRNPMAHNIRIESPERALEFISLINLLMKLLDNVKNY